MLNTGPICFIPGFKFATLDDFHVPSGYRHSCLRGGQTASKMFLESSPLSPPLLRKHSRTYHVEGCHRKLVSLSWWCRGVNTP